MPLVSSKSKDIITQSKRLSKSNIKDDLNYIRSKIDKIDKKIHNLIIDRSKYVNEIAKIKLKSSKSKLIIYRPAREQEVLINLLKRHKGDFPETVLIRIWRTMIGAYISMQGKLKISHVSSLDSLVRDYFGSTMEYNKINNNKISLDLMSFKSLDLLVLPLPNNRNNWWVHLFKNNKINIIGNLSSLSFKNSKGMILGSQEVEYTDYNKLIIIVALKRGNNNSFKKYILQNNYTILAKSNIKNKLSTFLITKNVISKSEANKGFISLKKLDFIENNYLRIVGVVPDIKNKEV